MTTFHSTISEGKAVNEGIISSFLTTSQLLCQCDYREEYNQIHSNAYPRDKIEGIAVKLSVLDSWNIDFSIILAATTMQIIVDAEENRLDNWLRGQIDDNTLSKLDLQRVYITVQAKRRDSEEQLKNLQKLGVRVILVPGSRAYLSSDEYKKDTSSLIAKMWTKYSNIALLGINSSMKSRLERDYSLVIDNNEVLELQGYQKLSDSKLWCYYSGEKLTSETFKYLNRRDLGESKTQQYVCTSIQDIRRLTQQHKVFLFIDACSQFQFIWRLTTIERGINQSKVNANF